MEASMLSNDDRMKVSDNDQKKLLDNDRMKLSDNDQIKQEELRKDIKIFATQINEYISACHENPWRYFLKKEKQRCNDARILLISLGLHSLANFEEQQTK